MKNISNSLSLSNEEERFELVHIQSDRLFELPTNFLTIVIGKSTLNQAVDIDLADLPEADLISRNHLQIHHQNNQFFIEDLGSSNGTFLNHKKLLPNQLYTLEKDALICLGKDEIITLIFRKKEITPTLITPSTAINSLSANNYLISIKNSLSTIMQSEKRWQKLLGMGLMAAGIITFIASTHIGIFFSSQVIVLWIIGAFLLFQKSLNPRWGWLIIAFGVGMMLFNSHTFFNISLMKLLISIILIGFGFFLFSSEKSIF